jgi:hypothetical protein
MLRVNRDIKDVHNQIKIKEKSKKIVILFNKAAGPITTNDHIRTVNKVFQEQRLQEGNSAQTPSSPDRRPWFFTLNKIRL